MFVRWMNGSCIDTPPIKILGEDEPYIHSYYTEVVLNPDLIQLGQALSSNVKEVITSITNYVSRFKKYRHLWKSEKAS